MKRLLPITLSLLMLLLSSCMSREEAAKHVTITLIESPQAELSEWHPIANSPVINTLITLPSATQFESPLGNIQISKIPTRLTTIADPQTIASLNLLKQRVEQNVANLHGSLINPADDDSLQLAGSDFLHTTYRIRSSDNQRQRIELFIAPINQNLITIVIQIGDDADMQSYSALQAFLNQQISHYTIR